MAKVKLKLDKRQNRVRSNGAYPVVIALHHKSKTRMIVLKYEFANENWDAHNCCPIGVQDAKHIGAKIGSQLMKAELFLREYQIEIELWSIQELKVKLEAHIFALKSTSDRSIERYTSKKVAAISLTDYAEQRVKRLRTAKKNGNADVIEYAISKLRGFRLQTEISFAEIDENFLKDFSAYCYSRGNKASTVSVYLRPIRALFNEAIAEGLIKKDIYPFHGFKIPNVGKTKNRALRTSDLAAIRELDLKNGSALSNARNCFLFMFNNMGVNFIDLVKLQRKHITRPEFDDLGQLISGRVVFERSKTNNEFSIKLTQESIQILNDLGIRSMEMEDFVFPFGFEESEKGRERYKQHRKRLNRKLKEMAKLAKIDEEITTYFARHTWATVAKRKMIPVSLISEALGHANLKTTQIYLDTFDSEDLDAANENIVS